MLNICFIESVMKLLAAIIALTSVSTAFAQDNYQGHRLGLGVSTGEYEEVSSDYHSTDLGFGLKVEYGYDFNRIIGLNVSYETNSEKDNFMGASIKSEVSTLTMDADIGYAFFLNGFNIKPYGAIGLGYVTDKVTVESISIKETETSLLVGTGVRADFSNGLYTDLRYQVVILDHYDLNQTSITVGYKF